MVTSTARPIRAPTEGTLRQIQARLGAEIVTLTHTLQLTLEQRQRLLREHEELSQQLDLLDTPPPILQSDGESDAEGDYYTE